MNGPVQLRQAKAACIVPEKWGLRQGVYGLGLVEDHPALINQQFDGAILRLVVHLFAVLDPVTEVHRLKPQALLPQTISIAGFQRNFQGSLGGALNSSQ